MLQIAICEDDTYMLRDLNIRIRQFLKSSDIPGQICCFTTGVKLVHEKKYFDVIVMDIKMAGMNGMDTIRLLQSKGIKSQVIFVTSSREHVFQAFDVDAVHYLIKPVSDEDLYHALHKALRRSVQIDRSTITVTKGSSLQIIHLCDILYCEAVDHKIFIHTVAGKVDCYHKLDALSKQLDDRFFRCHRSYIVNMDYVSGKELDCAILVNGEKILISRRKRQVFTEQLLIYIRGEVL